MSDAIRRRKPGRPKGHVVSEETRAKMRAAKADVSEETRAKMRAAKANVSDRSCFHCLGGARLVPLEGREGTHQIEWPFEIRVDAIRAHNELPTKVKLQEPIA